VGREAEGFVQDVPQAGGPMPARGLVDPEELAPGYGLQVPEDAGAQARAGGGKDDAAVEDQLIPETPGDAQSRPYAKETLGKIGELAPYINGYARKYGVPPLAVAGAIANEYDTRFDFKSKDLVPRIKALSHYDAFQDRHVPSLSNGGDSFADFARAMLDSKLVPTYAGSPGWLGSDVGPANIHMATALQLWHNDPGELPASVHDYPSLARYVVSNQGTAQLAAKYIAWAQRNFENSLGNTEKPLSPHDKAALYIDYFRKGPEMVGKQWIDRLTRDYGADKANRLVSGYLPLQGRDLPQPYDGVRAVVNRQALQDMLGQGEE